MCLLSEYKRSITLFCGLFFAVLFISTIAGSIYLIKVYGSAQDIKSYMESYTNSIKSGMDLWGITKSSLLSNAIFLIIVFISSYFNLGYVLSIIICMRKGFIDGFTISAINTVYGLKGAHLLIPYIPQALILIPLTCLFMSVSGVFSKNRKYMDKKSKIIYIIFSVAVFTIFSVSCVLEGLLTTTFAKWLSIKVT